VAVSSETGIVVTTCADLATESVSLAKGLRDAGVGAGTRVALCGPNSLAWMVVALAVMASGAVLVPIDDLCDAPQFEAALASSNVQMVVATAARLAAAAGPIRARGLRTLRLDGPATEAGSWRTLPYAEATPLPIPAPEDPLLLAWTSGTTGSPKIFALETRNIASNVEAIAAVDAVGEGDRALLPLPLHHAYPLVVGMLSSLNVGTAVVLPAGTTGPLILQALRDSEATVLIGVPRLYEAIVAALEARVAARGCLARLAWRAALGAASRLGRARLDVGRAVFLPVRRGLAPRLRLLISGGARLDAAIEERLGTLGWLVLCGYGLAETASLFTANLPGNRRLGSAGKPLGYGEMRIAAPNAQGVGEVQLRGPAVTSGYLDNPEANAAAFTADGWFRTGDLGTIDRDGFLFVSGRAKEILVLGGGKKIEPDALERSYVAAPGIAEIGVLDFDGALVGLVRPDAVALRARGVTNMRDGVHVALTVQAQGLPSYQRLAGFALTDAPLPRTQLGKLRRFLLPQLYAQALAGVTQRSARPLSDDDVILLRDPIAAGIWDLLQQRYPGKAIDLDVNLALDLNLDSFGWMELAVTLQDRFGVVLSEADIGTLATIRDLLRITTERRASPRAGGAAAIALDLDRWLAPTGPLLRAAGAALSMLNRLVMRTAFRLRVSGLERLPRGPFVITPNHASDLDPLALAAALPFARLRRLYWAGDMVRLFYSAPSRLFCRIVHLFPVDETHPGAAVAAASRVLAEGGTQVWFPEGWRSPDGQCGRFLPGIAQLLLRTDVPAVPVRIAGTFEALPRSRRVPRLHPVTVVFGDPVRCNVLRDEGAGQTDQERIADGLRRRVMTLAHG
jgi:long-chain acyl-CoA synthetase